MTRFSVYPHFALSLLTAAALCACGGGGGSSSETPAAAAAKPAAAGAPEPVAAAPAPVRESILTGTVAVVATPVTVTLQLVDPGQASQVITLTTTTDEQGNFSIAAPTAVIPKSSQVAALITADGYLPTVIVYASDESGNLSPVSTTDALGTSPVTGPITLDAAASGVFVFTGLDGLKRFGDGNATGPANSKLQLPTPPNDQPVITLASQRIEYADATKTGMQVSLLVRGLEVADCPGAQLTLRSFTVSNAELAAQSLALAASPVNGEFASQTFEFALDSAALSGGTLQLDIRTGYCGPKNYDDSEIVGATGIFK
jgi:hypothetical protein